MDNGIAEKINTALESKEEVYIDYNDETGDLLYAVGLMSDVGFWIDAFITKKEAIEFCNKNELPIKAVYICKEKCNE